MDAIKIDNKIIGEGCSCFIIAEAGINHNGQLGLAKKLVDVAKDTGADAVKFQTFKADDVVTKEAEVVKYQERSIGKKESQRDMLKKLELDYGDFKELREYCDKKGIIFMSTPHSEDAVDFLEDLVPAYKIGSGDLTNIPFLKKVAKKAKPVILGTGMSTIGEVKEAINVIRSQGNDKIIALHCTTNYPCPCGEVNLRAMITLQKELDCLAGYSDHTLGITTSIMAATLGAVVIEKHFTVDKNLSGPDHKASLEPDELREMVERIRDVEVIMGSSEKKPTKSEEEMMRLVRKSVVAAEDIPKGAKITMAMLAVKRPGTGIEPRDIDKIINKTANKYIPKDKLISLEDLK